MKLKLAPGRYVVEVREADGWSAWRVDDGVAIDGEELSAAAPMVNAFLDAEGERDAAALIDDAVYRYGTG